MKPGKTEQSRYSEIEASFSLFCDSCSTEVTKLRKCPTIGQWPTLFFEMNMWGKVHVFLILFFNL